MSASQPPTNISFKPTISPAPAADISLPPKPAPRPTPAPRISRAISLPIPQVSTSSLDGSTPPSLSPPARLPPPPPQPVAVYSNVAVVPSAPPPSPPPKTLHQFIRKQGAQRSKIPNFYNVPKKIPEKYVNL